MTKAEKARLDAIAARGCALCRHLGLGHTPAVVHHIRRGGGKRANSPEIPLCPRHHDKQIGGYGVAVHAGRVEWERRHGVTEMELLAMEEV